MNDLAVASLRPGRYRHYKGPMYEVLTEAQHTETGEAFVVYKALYGDHSIWIRPKSMFCETVEVDGKEKPRFTAVSES